MRWSNQSPGSAVNVVSRKNIAQPTDSITYPDVGEIKTLPRAENDDNKANCVALYRLSHKAIRRATKADVPIPPERF